ncbi:hypothetical protein CFOL_v3_28602 [Cephalotus follicularis]|uniref:UBN2 domain-containing protein n=1 Tax=Cephalotus follicularis TaxID=3775 RepID=A0A1Q3CY68_CEPFO|nr:hypothetical protein CFOL_v3_28602 [Cephalotus follicularis]
MEIKITTFIQSLDHDLWDIIVFGLEFPKENVSNSRIRYNEKEKEMLRLNAKAKHLMFCAWNYNVFDRISSCILAKEIWDRLEHIYEENNGEVTSLCHKLEHIYEENNVEVTSLCLMAREVSERESDEEDASKERNEVSYDEFIEVVDMYTLIISYLKNKIKCLTVENNELKINISSMNENESKKEEIGLLKKEISCLSKEYESLKNELDILNMSLELSTDFKEENEKLKIEVDALKKMF